MKKKYLQAIHPIRDLYSKSLRTSNNSIARKQQTQLKNGQGT
jgi:hypothetical protein